jgi:hypothetical protein
MTSIGCDEEEGRKEGKKEGREEREERKDVQIKSQHTSKF